jgi:predicted nucleic acid-binding protein
MNEGYVVDASIALAWVHPAQATRETDALLEKLREGVTLVLPALWFQETANALLVLQRRQKLTSDERHEALATLKALNIKPDFEGASLAFGRVSELAERHGLSVYDATYLELALRERVPLITKDEALRSAAEKCDARTTLENG